MKASPSLAWVLLLGSGCAGEHDGPTPRPGATASATSPIEATASAPNATATSSSEPAALPSTSAATETPPPKSAAAQESPEWPSAAQLSAGFPTPEPGDRIYSKSRHLWIRSQAGGKGSDWLGYLSLGDSVRVKGGDAARAKVGSGESTWCKEWYAVEPRGFVCTGLEATLDANDPEIVELVRTRANVTSPWPYRYAESLGTPVASKLPAGSNATKGATVPALFPLNPAGRTLFQDIAPGSTVAYTDEFEHDGTRYLLTWDRGIVESERVKPYPESPFHGVPIGGDITLPLAFVRSDAGAEILRRGDDGALVTTGETLPRLAWATLTGKSEGEGRERAHELRDGRWLRGGELAIATAAEVTPALVEGSKGRRTWVDISILGGTLVAYEDKTPVYVTMVSPGRGGVPFPGVPTLETASTPVGLFSVLGKFTTATMISSTVKTLVHTEVQYTQNFEGPYSLHGAYWHDRWGKKKSAGCVNLAPVDARRLFAWTDPPLPEGWHGLRWSASVGPRTLVNLRP